MLTNISSKLLLFIAGVVAMVSATNNCYYYYGVQKTGSTCDAQGGVDEDIQTKMWQVQGGLEGIKAISSINTHLLTTMQNNMRRIQQQYSNYASTLASIKKDIEDLKMIMNPVPDEPGTDEVRQKRIAADPNQNAKRALSVAEWKLINITSMLQDTMRSRSMMESTLEQRLQKQQLELKDVMKKITDLENAISHPRGKRSAPLGSVSTLQSKVLGMTQKVMDLLVEVNSRREISRIRTADLKQQLDSFKVQRDEQTQKINNLTATVNGVPARLNKVDTDVSSLRSDVVTSDNKLKPKMVKAVSSYSNLILNYQNSSKDADKTINDINIEKMAVQKDNSTLWGIKSTLSNDLIDINDVKKNATSFRIDIMSLRSSPIIAIGSLEFYANQAIQKQENDIKKLQMMFNATAHNFQSLQKPTAGK